MNPWTNIALALIPELAAVVQAIRNLKTKYPTLTADQVNAIVADQTSQAETAFDGVLSQIAADKAAHPGA
jgi:hypothetical protein